MYWTMEIKEEMISVTEITERKRSRHPVWWGLHLKPLYALLDATVITIKDGRTPNLITMSHNAGVPKELRKRLERLIGPSAPTAAGTHLASHYCLQAGSGNSSARTGDLCLNMVPRAPDADWRSSVVWPCCKDGAGGISPEDHQTMCVYKCTHTISVWVVLYNRKK
jgi:hypothetical protein